MQNHEIFPEKLLIALTPILLIMHVGTFLSVITQIIIIIFYLSKLKKDIINADYEGSWLMYIKSILLKFKSFLKK